MESMNFRPSQMDCPHALRTPITGITGKAVKKKWNYFKEILRATLMVDSLISNKPRQSYPENFCCIIKRFFFATEAK